MAGGQCPDATPAVNRKEVDGAGARFLPCQEQWRQADPGGIISINEPVVQPPCPCRYPEKMTCHRPSTRSRVSGRHDRQRTAAPCASSGMKAASRLKGLILIASRATEVFVLRFCGLVTRSGAIFLLAGTGDVILRPETPRWLTPTGRLIPSRVTRD